MRPTDRDAIALVGAVLIAALLVAAAAPRARCASRRGRRAAMARRAAPAGAAPLPDAWSWTHVSDDDAREWRSANAAAHLAPGCYASRVQNQHRSGWCGCCYLVAVAQSIQDRWNLVVGRHPAVREMHPFVELDLQRMLDDYDRVRGQAWPGWNACQGGDPRRVIACLESGACALHVAPPEGYAWLGHPRARTAPPLPRPSDDRDGARAVRVAGFATLPNDRDAVKRAIYERGTVVLGIDAQTLLNAGADGVADVTSRHERNHAVTVVGWTRRAEGTEECWIVRNSWGYDEVPANVPADMHCVRAGANACREATRPWHGAPGLPGYVLLPMDYVEHMASGSDGMPPWWECLVAARGDAPPEGF